MLPAEKPSQRLLRNFFDFFGFYVKSLDKDVDQAAVEAVKQWLFAPGKKNGKPVAVNIQIEVRFHSM